MLSRSHHEGFGGRGGGQVQVVAEGIAERAREVLLEVVAAVAVGLQQLQVKELQTNRAYSPHRGQWHCCTRKMHETACNETAAADP